MFDYKQFDTFVTMRAGLLHILFVVITLLIVSSEQTNKKQTSSDLSSCHSIVLSNIACIVPEINLSPKKLLTDLNFCLLIRADFFENVNSNGRDLSAICLKLYQIKIAVFEPLKQKPFRLIIYNTSEKEDYHHLS
jgi:hypothetical protein